MALSFRPALGPLYLVIALPATLHLLWQSYGLLRLPQVRQAKALFMTSNVYLTLILVAICLDLVL